MAVISPGFDLLRIEKTVQTREEPQCLQVMNDTSCPVCVRVLVRVHEVNRALAHPLEAGQSRGSEPCPSTVPERSYYEACRALGLKRAWARHGWDNVTAL